MYLTPQLSINIRLRKIRNSHIQSEMPKCLKCTARACGAHSQPARAEGRRAGRSRHAGNEEEGGGVLHTHRREQRPEPPTAPLRGASKEILRGGTWPRDARQVRHSDRRDPSSLPGWSLCNGRGPCLERKIHSRDGMEQWPDRAVAPASQVIPRTLIQNCGAGTIRLLPCLRAKHT